MAFSPDNRYIEMDETPGGGCSASIDETCGYGIIQVFDVQTKKIVFQDTGGSGRSNDVRFAWSPDGRLFYLFSGEGISNLTIVGPANFSVGQ